MKRSEHLRDAIFLMLRYTGAKRKMIAFAAKCDGFDVWIAGCSLDRRGDFTHHFPVQNVSARIAKRQMENAVRDLFFYFIRHGLSLYNLFFVFGMNFFDQFVGPFFSGGQKLAHFDEVHLAAFFGTFVECAETCFSFGHHIETQP